jgi:hypothetical protein
MAGTQNPLEPKVLEAANLDDRQIRGVLRAKAADRSNGMLIRINDTNGRIDCEHVFAERLNRGEVIIIGEVERRRAESAKAGRQPARKRIAANGRSMRSVQRDARVALGERIPELLRDLVRAMEQTYEKA